MDLNLDVLECKLSICIGLFTEEEMLVHSAHLLSLGSIPFLSCLCSPCLHFYVNCDVEATWLASGEGQ